MATGDLTTLANAKAWLGIASGDTSQDALIARLITATSLTIQDWLGRLIATQTYALTFDGKGGCRLVIGNAPVTAISSLMVDGIAVPAAASITFSGYRFTNLGAPVANACAIDLTGYRFTHGLSNIALTCTAGYASTPLEVEQACLQALQGLYVGKDREPGIKSETIPGTYSVTYDGMRVDLDADTLQMLRGYKRVTP